MTSDQSPEVRKARAELVAALSELEDKLNVPKRLRRFRTEQPAKFRAAVAGAASAGAGILALVIVTATRKR